MTEVSLWNELHKLCLENAPVEMILWGGSTKVISFLRGCGSTKTAKKETLL
jgi:hypothetical protein